MLNNVSRARVIQVWFAAVALVFVAAGTFGADVTLATVGMTLALSVVPPIIIFLLWPRPQSLTAGEVLRGTERS